jgi:hypothetical protein
MRDWTAFGPTGQLYTESHVSKFMDRFALNPAIIVLLELHLASQLASVSICSRGEFTVPTKDPNWAAPRGGDR